MGLNWIDVLQNSAKLNYTTNWQIYVQKNIDIWRYWYITYKTIQCQLYNSELLDCLQDIKTGFFYTYLKLNRSKN